MAKENELDERFITYLEDLREDRAALARLRRGVGQAPGSEPQMYPYVEPWLAEASRGWRENVYYLIAALFAYHPQPGGSGNMGHHFVKARDTHEDQTALERRFVALLAAHPDDLQRFHLRQAISFLRSKEVAVNWSRLLADLQGWGHSERYIQQQWARAFWAGNLTREGENTTTD